MLSPESLQNYMRAAAAHTHDVIEVPPFVLFFNPNDALRFYNYAVPAAPVRDIPAETMAALRNAFAQRERLLRFEFIEEYAPDLGAALAAAGLAEEERNPLMVCTIDSLRAAPHVPGLEIRRLTPESPAADLSAFISVQGRGFNEDERVEPTGAQVEDLRRRSGQGSHYFLARLGELAVAAGAYTAPLDGFTELVGIATLSEFRHRGIAGALTATMAQAAFAGGVSTAFLGAGNERAGRVYERVGFRPFATALAYSED